MVKAVNDSERCIITLTGIVQGVGMRPFVFRKAKELKINGWVENQGSRVLIDAEGKKENIQKLIKILNHCPENAKISEISISYKALKGYSEFYIKNSTDEHNTAKFIPPDIAVCTKCIEEFNDINNKRYQYPFISCTDCGPRYSIINSLPYDRKSITMNAFELCEECTYEYREPLDRRFHAQTNCCPNCGPVLKLLDASGKEIYTETPGIQAQKLIGEGKMLAVKGIGGYHLCCNAKSPEAVGRLRNLKKRPHKPLAIMAKDIEAVYEICHISNKEKETLTGKKKPILLLRKKYPEILPEAIAPNQKSLGVMLPYAPIHFFLFSESIKYLIMTSGNVSGSPISYKDEDALQALKGIADYFLVHNREINMPVDDSVVKVIREEEVLIRCGRGYAPVTLPLDSDYNIMALGSEQKSSICVAGKGFSAISQYLGDLKEYKAYQVFENQIAYFKQFFNYTPEIYVHDMNADYISSCYGKKNKEKRIAVQHHHAHMAGCMAENKLFCDAIGIIYDGTGLGTDEALWGGEFFTGSLSGFKRVGHLKYTKLQGGDSVVQEPWRCAANYLFSMGIDPSEYLKEIKKENLDFIYKAMENNIKCFQSSSMGRFFDCVSALCGFQSKITYDAQAAIELEGIADEGIKEFYGYAIAFEKEGIMLEYEDILKEILADIKKDTPSSIIASKFHNTIIEATSDCACKIRGKSGLQDIVLSGGVFENTYILEGLIYKLESLGFHVYHHHLTPANDGGLAFGQAAAASFMMKEDKKERAV